MMSVEPSERLVTRLVAATPLYFYRDDVAPPGFFSNQLRKLNENIVSQSEMSEELKRSYKKRWVNDPPTIPNAFSQRKRKRSIVGHNTNHISVTGTDASATVSAQPSVAFPPTGSNTPLPDGPNLMPIYHPFNSFMTPNVFIDLRVSSQLYSHSGDNPLDLSCADRDQLQPLVSQHCTTPQAKFLRPYGPSALPGEEDEKATSVSSVIEERQEVKVTVKRCTSESDKSNLVKDQHRRSPPFNLTEDPNISPKGRPPSASCLITESAIQEILKTKLVATTTTTLSTKRSHAYAIDSLLKTDSPDDIEDDVFSKRKNPDLLSNQLSAFSIPSSSPSDDNHIPKCSNGSYHAFYKNLPTIFESITKPTV